MEFKEFKPTDEMLEAAKTCFMAMALVETVKPIVRGYETEILKTLQAPIAQKWVDKGEKRRIITEPEHAYLLDQATWDVYHERCNEARIKAGLDVPDPDYCPLLMAEETLRKAQARLIDTMEPVTGLNHDRIFQSRHALKNYRKLVDLTLRLLAPYIA